MLFLSILLFIYEIIAFVVSSITLGGPFGIASGVICLILDIIGIIVSIVRIKSANKRGQSITALVFFITNLVMAVCLLFVAATLSSIQPVSLAL